MHFRSIRDLDACTRCERAVLLVRTTVGLSCVMVNFRSWKITTKKWWTGSRTVSQNVGLVLGHCLRTSPAYLLLTLIGISNTEKHCSSIYLSVNLNINSAWNPVCCNKSSALRLFKLKFILITTSSHLLYLSNVSNLF